MERPYVNARQLVSLENEALGSLDIDHDEVAERPFFPPTFVRVVEDHLTKAQERKR